MSENFPSNELDFDELGINPDAETETDQSTYEPPVKGFIPPKIGDARVVGVPNSYQWGRGADGYLYVRGSFKVIESDDEGKRVDGFISTRPDTWRKSGGSSMDDFIAAFADKPKPANGSHYTYKEISQIVKDTWEFPRNVYIDREAYCADCQKTVARGKNGAKKEDKSGFKAIGFAVDGVVHNSVKCPLCGKALMGRGKVGRWYAA